MAQKGAGMKQLTPPEILAKLDPEQRIAVEAPIGPVRIIAGAGTGKTRTLIYRIAYWDSMGIAPSDKTLSVTHSNKSAAELRHRLKELVAKSSDWPQITKIERELISIYRLTERSTEADEAERRLSTLTEVVQ